MIKRLFDSEGANALRSLVRAVVLVLTAFALSLSAEQVAAVQVLLEALIYVGVRLVPNPEKTPANDGA